VSQRHLSKHLRDCSQGSNVSHVTIPTRVGRVQEVRLTISVEVEEYLEGLETTDPLRFEIALDDMRLLEEFGLVDAQLLAMFGQWMSLTGPTGRVSYWLSPSNDDLWSVESLTVD
jgi:hypothetical protein